MKNFKKLVLILAIVGFNNYSNAQNFVWAKQMSGNFDEKGFSIDFDAAGNVYTTGLFGGTVDFDPGVGVFNLTATSPDDVFVTKLDATGNFVWAKQMGGVNVTNSQKFSLILDASGNIYIAGHFGGTRDFDPSVNTFNLTAIGNIDIFISKLDTDGNFIWAKRIGGVGSFNYGANINIDYLGNIYLTGFFSHTADFDSGVGVFNLISTGNYEVFILKLDATGNFLWAKKMGGTADDRGTAIGFDSLGNSYTTGFFAGVVDFNPNEGINNLTSAGSRDIFIVKLDPDGNFVWAKQMGGGNADQSRSLAVDNSGNVYTAGYFQLTADFDPDITTYNLTAAGGGGTDIFISKLDTNGNFVWAKRMGGTSSDDCFSICLDATGNVYATGDFQLTVDFDPGAGISNFTAAGSHDIFISKLDVDGNFVWAKQMGGTNLDLSYAIALDPLGNIYTTGLFKLTADFDPGAGTFNMTAVAGEEDIFIAKLDNTTLNTTENFINSEISIFPNPTKNNVLFSAPSDVKLFDLSGQILANEKNITTLDLSKHSSGIYIINCYNNENQVIQKTKIIKE